MRIVMLFALAIGMSGYGLLLYEKRIRTELIPVLLTSSIVSVLYIAGILNILLPMTYAIVAVGAVLCVKYAVTFSKRKQWGDIAKAFITLPNILMGLLLLLFGMLMRNAKFLSYDNFSHWALIAKQMNADNRLPNFTNSIIEFSSYPPGSALFIYFVTQFLGFTEGRAMFAQCILVFSCLWSIFAFIPKTNHWLGVRMLALKTLLPTVVALLCMLLITFGIVSIYDLLVDTLLTAIGISGFAVIYYYRHEIKKAAWFSIPISTTVGIIKSAGLLFFILNMIMLLYLFLRDQKKRASEQKSWRPVLYALLIPLIAFYLWNAHTDMVFQNAHQSKHALSISRYQKELNSKSPEEITAIQKLWWETTFSSDNANAKWLALWNICLISLAILLFLSGRKGYKILLSAAALFDLIFLVYVVGMYFMYLFSMPTNEALYLASYDRYLKVVCYYFIGVGTILTLSIAVDSLNSKFVFSICLILPLILLGSQAYEHRDEMSSLLKPPVYAGSRREQIELALNRNFGEGSIMIYAPEPNSRGYTVYVLKYELLSSNFAFITTYEGKEQLIKKIKQWDYLVILDEDEMISQIMRERLGTNQESYIGSYKVQDVF